MQKPYVVLMCRLLKNRCCGSWTGLIVSAMNCNLHLNLILLSMPGRWVQNDPQTFTDVGGFDLITKPKKQEQAVRI